jgi:hypothetical protein
MKEVWSDWYSDGKPDLKLVRFPTRSSLTLATLPPTSLVPVAPFTVGLKALFVVVTGPQAA